MGPVHPGPGTGTRPSASESAPPVSRQRWRPACNPPGPSYLSPASKPPGPLDSEQKKNLRKQLWTVSGDVKTAAGRVSGSGRRLLQGRRWCAAAVSSSRLQRPAHRSAHNSAHRSAPPLGTVPCRTMCTVVPKSAAAHALHARNTSHSAAAPHPA